MLKKDFAWGAGWAREGAKPFLLLTAVVAAAAFSPSLPVAVQLRGLQRRPSPLRCCEGAQGGGGAGAGGEDLNAAFMKRVGEVEQEKRREQQQRQAGLLTSGQWNATVAVLLLVIVAACFSQFSMCSTRRGRRRCGSGRPRPAVPSSVLQR